jgi:predicted secreted protein
VKRIFIICLVLLSSSLLFGGDIAKFANLGFSDDSRYFMFGSYGVTEDGAKQYAELHVVDVAGNRFVPEGSYQQIYDEQPDPGQDGFGAMLTLYNDNVESTKTYRVNHMKSGRLLYLLVDGKEPKPVLSFRDFGTGRSYRVELTQSVYGADKQVSASFHINLAVTSSSGDKHYTIGLPNYRRDGVQAYRIKRIFSSPDDESLVFVVEKAEYADSGFDVRYMVESVELD